MTEVFVAVLAEASVLSSLFGLFIWNWQRKITRRDKARDEAEAARAKAQEEKEKAREELDLNMVRSFSGLFAVVEAIAEGVQRIPDAHCNGEMTKALEYSKKVKHDLRGFLEKQGIHALHED